LEQQIICFQQKNNENGGRRFGQFLGRSGSDRQSRGRSGPVDAPLFFFLFISLHLPGFSSNGSSCSWHSGHFAALRLATFFSSAQKPVGLYLHQELSLGAGYFYNFSPSRAPLKRISNAAGNAPRGNW